MVHRLSDISEELVEALPGPGETEDADKPTAAKSGKDYETNNLVGTLVKHDCEDDVGAAEDSEKAIKRVHRIVEVASDAEGSELENELDNENDDENDIGHCEDVLHVAWRTRVLVREHERVDNDAEVDEGVKIRVRDNFVAEALRERAICRRLERILHREANAAFLRLR